MNDTGNSKHGVLLSETFPALLCGRPAGVFLRNWHTAVFAANFGSKNCSGADADTEKDADS